MIFPDCHDGGLKAAHYEDVKKFFANNIVAVSGTHRHVGTVSDHIFNGVTPGMWVWADDHGRSDVNAVLWVFLVLFFTSGNQAPLIQDWDIVWELDKEVGSSGMNNCGVGPASGKNLTPWIQDWDYIVSECSPGVRDTTVADHTSFTKTPLRNHWYTNVAVCLTHSHRLHKHTQPQVPASKLRLPPLDETDPRTVTPLQELEGGVDKIEAFKKTTTDWNKKLTILSDATKENNRERLKEADFTFDDYEPDLLESSVAK